MSNFIKELVSKKLKQLSPEELLNYAKQHGFSLNRAEANSIINYLRTNSIDPFNLHDHKKMFEELTQITNRETANKAQKLFNDLIQSYGLGHLFHE
ncbi:hypothetical protein J2Z83_000779 [Virgibacillus natechei]|uniref:DUF2624 domain-containing protein n=1 Tax=Virgibacillus natechei TaxID=1216297 RepID=A0ABS4ICR7_9BACI|nr:DUF2624 domain-containing protein [Virgibacillus natechei]MBP1968685.1 hypothetical protein [Virgibacillus natechei]UZD11487.1 DUF2624 domain-containing protein [Virgibacillus natechei]